MKEYFKCPVRHKGHIKVKHNLLNRKWKYELLLMADIFFLCWKRTRWTKIKVKWFGGWRQKFEFRAVGVAWKAVIWPALGVKEGTFDRCGSKKIVSLSWFSLEETLGIYASAAPHYRSVKPWRGDWTFLFLSARNMKLTTKVIEHTLVYEDAYNEISLLSYCGLILA